MKHGISARFVLGVQPKLSGISNIASPPCSLPHCAGSPVDMHSANIPSECEECVAECDVETCDLGAESSQCTDRCLVVPCDDPCPDICATACIPWFDSPCESASYQGFQDFPGHCTELPTQSNDLSVSFQTQLLQQHQECYDTRHPDWNKESLSSELDAFVCACTTQSQSRSSDCNTCDPRLLSVDKSCAHLRRHHPSIPHSISGQTSIFDPPASVFISPLITTSASARLSPDPSSTSTSTSNTQPSPPLDTAENGSRAKVISYQPQPSDNFLCLWAECRKSFRSSQDLISHVNASHFHLPITPGSLSRRISSSQPLPPPVLQFHPGNTVGPSPSSASCMWGDCNAHPTLSDIPQPPTGNVTDAALGLLASHLLQDHLGVPVLHPATPGPELTGPRMLTDDSRTINRHASLLPHPPDVPAPVSLSYSTPVPPQPLVSCPLNDLTQHALQHRCKWQRCLHAQIAFSSSADLTTHITDVHVGSGKNRYDCMWEGCNRQGAAGFSSKQKILRHIQSHTGHRPFRCKLCDQFFSEAATLQQHIRRHTKEKPYVCDFPGCSKAFAITGALTIHKRTHSGKKPFKCTYCDRSFSESSNLSKHVRTHTGDRPYPCSHPGCEKRFARPDQVARHMNVHNKKRQAVDVGDSEAAVGDLDEVQEMEIEE